MLPSKAGGGQGGAPDTKKTLGHVIKRDGEIVKQTTEPDKKIQRRLRRLRERGTGSRGPWKPVNGGAPGLKK